MNWQLIILDIQKHGLTQHEIAARVGCSQTSISELKCGKVTDPHSSIGIGVLKLHESLHSAATTSPSPEQGQTVATVGVRRVA